MDRHGPSTYGDRIADAYDDWYGREQMDPSGAGEVLLPLAQGRWALELGIGTGRAALLLAAFGVDVSGIDASSRIVEKLGHNPTFFALASREDHPH